jgi:RNA polymerase sigma-70 factor (ECF subfamily)
MSEPIESLNPYPLEALLAKLGAGDDAAAQEVFRTYEPCLRALVRRMLPVQMRCKFDSDDVLQSVFADLWRGFREAGWQFTSAGHLRAFLIKVTRNRFIDRVRQNRKPVALQQSLPTEGGADLLAGTDDRPSEVAQADELWERMLALCPTQHRRLLELRRDGHTLHEIAAEIGLHESSVRRILYDLARRLATQA